jgi:hypothetical protein
MASAISGSVTCGSSALICINIASRRLSSAARVLGDCSGSRNIVARRSSNISTTNRLSELLSLTKVSSLGSPSAKSPYAHSAIEYSASESLIALGKFRKAGVAA